MTPWPWGGSKDLQYQSRTIKRDDKVRGIKNCTKLVNVIYGRPLS